MSTDYILFEFNCKFNPQVLFKKDIDSYLKSYSTNKLAKELKKLIDICYQNLFYIQKL